MSNRQKAIDFFSKLRVPPGNVDEAFGYWKDDLGTLIECEVIKDPDVLFRIHWDLVVGKWHREVPLLLKEDGNGKARLLLYYWLTEKLARGFRMTPFLFRELPVKVNLITSADVNGDACAKLTDDCSAIRINIPPSSCIIKPNSLEKECTNFLGENDFSEIWPEENGETDHDDGVPCGFRSVKNSDIRTFAKDTNIPEEIKSVVKEGAIFNTGSDAYKKIKENLTDKVFPALKEGSDHSANWGFDSEKYESFIKVTALNALIISASEGIKDIRHYPSTDALNLIDAGEESPSYKELATGGVIIHCGEDTHIEDNLLKELINLRNRANSIEQHKQRATKRIREHALRSAIAAIMGRNMSHNIGSHVLWHLSQQLGPGEDEPCE